MAKVFLNQILQHIPKKRKGGKGEVSMFEESAQLLEDLKKAKTDADIEVAWKRWDTVKIKLGENAKIRNSTARALQ
jgi:RecA-family ATPase